MNVTDLDAFVADLASASANPDRYFRHTVAALACGATLDSAIALAGKLDLRESRFVNRMAWELDRYNKGWVPGPNALWKHKSPDEMASDLAGETNLQGVKSPTNGIRSKLEAIAKSQGYEDADLAELDDDDIEKAFGGALKAQEREQAESGETNEEPAEQAKLPVSPNNILDVAADLLHEKHGKSGLVPFKEIAERFDDVDQAREAVMQLWRDNRDNPYEGIAIQGNSHDDSPDAFYVEFKNPPAMQEKTPPPGMDKAILGHFDELLKGEHSGLVPIWKMREKIAHDMGVDNARHDILDGAILQLWRDGKIGLEGISDLSKATEKQLSAAIAGVGNTLFYLEKPRLRNERDDFAERYDKGWVPGPNALWKHKSPDEMASDLAGHQPPGAPAEAASHRHSPAAMRAHAKSLADTSLDGMVQELSGKAPGVPPPVHLTKKQPATDELRANPKPELVSNKGPESLANTTPDQLASTIGSAKNGSMEGGRALYDSLDGDANTGYKKPLLAVVGQRFKQGSPEFDDAMQTATMAVIEKAGKFRPTENPEQDKKQFAAFAQQVAEQSIIGEHRKGKTKKRGEGKTAEFAEGEEGNIAGKQESPLESAEKSEQVERVNAAIGKLEPQMQEAVKMVMANDKVTDASLGERLGVHPQKARRIRLAAMEALREALSDKYEYGPRHQPTKRIDGAVARLEALRDHAQDIDEEDLAEEIDGIAREFMLDDFKEICRAFGIKSGLRTKTAAVMLVFDRVKKKAA